MSERTSFVGIRRFRNLLLGAFLCAAAGWMLTANATPAHALFTADVQVSTAQAVKAFPTGLTVDAEDYKAYGKDIDRAQLTVTATYSDGTSRQLDADEYELSVDAFASGYKGAIDDEATYVEAGHRVTAPFTVKADEAYGAQYGNVLVFGRGIPADMYESKALKNTTWGIENRNYSIRWNKNEIVKAVDIDTISPQLHIFGWFNESTTLQQVSLTHIDMSRVTSLGQTFVKCSALTRVYGIEDWDVSNVTTFGFMFGQDTQLVSADLTKWNTASLRDINGMFQNCRSLTSVGNLRGWKTSNLTQMGNTFQCCSSLTTVGDLSTWNVSNVTWMMETFQQCAVLKDIGDVSNWNTAKVTNMYQMMQLSPYLVANCSKWNVDNVTNHVSFNGSSGYVVPPNWKS